MALVVSLNTKAKARLNLAFKRASLLLPSNSSIKMVSKVILKICKALCIKSSSHRRNYSHSIVPGGLFVISYTTRFTPGTSLTIRPATRPSSSYGSCANCAFT